MSQTDSNLEPIERASIDELRNLQLSRDLAGPYPLQRQL